jgi:hypothetical protein
MSQGGEKVSLPYADAATQWGVGFERTDELVRVVLPPVLRVRNLSKGYFIGAAVLLALLMFSTAIGLSGRDPGWIVGVGLYGAPLLILIAFGFQRLAERIVLTITRDDFSLVRVSPGSAGRAAVYPLGRVSVNVNRYNGKLAIHTGLDLIELDIGATRVTEEVAQFLQAAIADPPRVPPAPIAPMARNESARGLLIACGVGCGVFALLLLLLGAPWSGLCVVPLLIAMVPLGIAYGTQKKEYWL